ncbi:MAG: EAL domain-containing protein [Gammaproteobacteria bacterium]|nr:EAL domain-containing protein [Gammaproteobacteria bacterium]MBT3724597.1 EAL domain-containing protein [Gammaproteobacteria bacterium]MBT4077982.1 EAL domain-containing protein [Gammaproteobacteria bacterium]MBT4194388.1 EAL domain-containing protein [Gammaproteobacteria bacterium]MBT4450752.1 EAL domain-containing protein [Gammaproteobacteria bacterium]
MILDKSAFIKAEKIRNLYGSSAPSAIGIFIIAIIASIGFSSVLNHYLIYTWSFCMISIAGARLLLNRKFEQRSIKNNIDRWANLFTLNTMIAGIGWAALSLFLLQLDSPNYQMAITLIILGVMGASVPLLSFYLPAFISSSLPVAILLPVIIYTQLEVTAILLSSAALLFISLLYFISFKHHLNFEKRVLLQYENSDLVESLKEEINTHQQTQAKLEFQQQHLESTVQQRTRQLSLSNKDLKKEMLERKEAEAQIQILSLAVDQSPISVVITDPSAKIEYVNNSFLSVSGYDETEVIGKTPSFLQSGNTPAGNYRDLWQNLQAGKSWQGEFQNRNKSGDIFWENVHISPVLDKSGKTRHYLALKENITHQKHQDEKIQHQTHYDHLTNLPNRVLVLDRLNQQLLESSRDNNIVAVVYLDLDNFKRINETLGHDLGDKLLIEASDRLHRSVRIGDTVGRLGGDEFIVILGNLATATDARPIVENMLHYFREPFRINTRNLVMTISIGIAVSPDDGDTSTVLLRNADSAMFHAKERGRNTYSYFTDEMNQEVSRRLLLEEQMHGGLNRNEFCVVYQPQVEIKTGETIGAEALLRWNNPALGAVSPDEFIPIAEQTGLIGDIGKFVLQQAISNIPKWKTMAGNNFTVAINISPNQFSDPNLITFIKGILNEHKVSGKSIELEITEGVLMSGYSNIKNSLEELHEQGILIAMDDFGTGYSSLSYLRMYPFNILKIDKSFIDDITVDPADMELVNAAISMSHSLGLKVVAEGVEAQEQLELLSNKDCDYVQGYLFSKPINTDEFTKLLGQ